MQRCYVRCVDPRKLVAEPTIDPDPDRDHQPTGAPADPPDRPPNGNSRTHPVNVAARIVLKIGLYSPKKWARGVTCPALIQIADEDAVTPRHVAEATAALMAAPTVHVYPGGHFDPYVEPLFTAVVDDQLAFLREHVPVEMAR